MARRFGILQRSVSGLNRISFLVGGMQHLDQAVFQFKALMQQSAECLELFGNTLSCITQVIEGEQLFGDDVDTRIDRLGELQATLVVEGLGLPVSCS